MSTALQRTALISVSEKTDLVPFATQLIKLNFQILASGGTAKILQEANITVIEISDYTRFAECLAGRVKTLHPKIHAGILARGEQDAQTLEDLNITPIELVVVNLYPFAQTIAKQNCTFAQAIENIDIGGPTLIRGAAKNHAHVTTVVEPKDYQRVISTLERSANTSTIDELQVLRKKLALKAFQHTANYDATISHYLQAQFLEAQADSTTNVFPEQLIQTWQRAPKGQLRYGENPHQQAAVYTNPDKPGIGILHATQLQGATLSYNNLADADAAFELVQRLANPACVIVKHANPCGVAIAESAEQAYIKALTCDKQSAFGGVIAFNAPIDKTCALALIELPLIEIILAPAFHAAALEVLSTKPRIRVLDTVALATSTVDNLQFRSIQGGLLVQTSDNAKLLPRHCQVVTDKQPSETEWLDLFFAWEVVRATHSNAIVYVKKGQTLGIGTGQTSRIFSAEIAAKRAESAKFNLGKAVMASDAFFPFPDSVETAAKLGISAIIQPGGSKKDPEVIKMANQLGVSMVFTAQRVFKH